MLKIDALDLTERTAMHYSAIRGNYEILKALHKAGADPNLADAEGNTPLHKSSEYGHDSCVVYLLKEARANLAAKNFIGNSAWDIA